MKKFSSAVVHRRLHHFVALVVASADVVGAIFVFLASFLNALTVITGICGIEANMSYWKVL